jgi:hypothetical protein
LQDEYFKYFSIFVGKMHACVEKSFDGPKEGKRFSCEDFALSADPKLVVLLTNQETKQTNIIISDANKFGKIVEKDDLCQSVVESIRIEFEILQIKLKEQKELLKKETIAKKTCKRH